MTEKTKKKHGILYRILHALTKFILVIFALILLLFGLINLPPVQKFLTKRATSFLEKKLDANAEIGRIGWSLPDHVFVEDVLLENPQGDSLFVIGNFELGINLIGLLSRKVEIEYLELNKLKGDLIFRPDSSNIDFITEAFSAADTTTTTPQPTTTPTQSAPWDIRLGNATVSLKDIDVLYDDMPGGIRLDLQVGDFNGTIGDTDILKNRYFIDDISLKNSDINYKSYPVVDTSKSTTVLDYTIGVGTLSANQVNFKMDADSLQLQTNIPALQSSGISARLLRDSIGAEVQQFDLTDADLKYDIVGSPEMEGFDANHLDLNGVSADINDLIYSNLTVEATVSNLSGSSDNKVNLKQVKGEVVFDKNGLQLENFVLNTSRSNLAESDITLRQNFLNPNANLENMGVNIDIPSGTLSPQDVLYFAPQLEEYFTEKQPMTFAAAAQGSLRELSVQKFPLRRTRSQNSNARKNIQCAECQ